jgi:hypothetical protein
MEFDDSWEREFFSELHAQGEALGLPNGMQTVMLGCDPPDGHPRRGWVALEARGSHVRYEFTLDRDPVEIAARVLAWLEKGTPLSD